MDWTLYRRLHIEGCGNFMKCPRKLLLWPQFFTDFDVLHTRANLILSFIHWFNPKLRIKFVTVHNNHISTLTSFFKITLGDLARKLYVTVINHQKRKWSPPRGLNDGGKKLWKKNFFLFFFHFFYILGRCLHICLHRCLHSHHTIHAQCFLSQIHPRASIGTIGIDFEAISPCILTTHLKSLFFKRDFFITFDFVWCL